MYRTNDVATTQSDGSGVAPRNRDASPEIDSLVAHPGGRRTLSARIELVLELSRAELKAESERTYLGVMWWIFEPLINMLVYYLVFKTFLHRGTEDFVPFLLIGIVPWLWLANNINNGQRALLKNKALMRQAPLNKAIFPMVEFVVSLPRFCLGMLLLFIFLMLFGHYPTVCYAAIPFVMFVQVSFMFALLMPLSAVVPFVPDLANLVSNLMRLWFYLSGIFYSVEHIPDRYRGFFLLNPMAVLIASYRNVMLDGVWPTMPARLILIMIVSIVVAGAGTLMLQRWDRQYAKRIYK